MTKEDKLTLPKGVMFGNDQVKLITMFDLIEQALVLGVIVRADVPSLIGGTHPKYALGSSINDDTAGTILNRDTTMITRFYLSDFALEAINELASTSSIHQTVTH
jgi:hypothetical protein